jgi:hypothetical protein
MSAAELAEAEQAVRNLQFAVKPIRTRRSTPDRYGPAPIPAPPCARRDAARGKSSASNARRRASAIPTSWRFAISRGRCPSIRGCCCATSMRSPTRPARVGPCPRLHLRHVADQRHPRLEAERSRPRPRRRRARGQRLGGRHTHRCVAGAVQQGVVAPRPDIWGDRDADHRRAGTRRSRPARPGGRAAFAERRASRVAEPLVALGGVFTPRGRRPDAHGHVDSFHACHSLDSLQALTEALGRRTCATACWPRRVRRISVFWPWATGIV